LALSATKNSHTQTLNPQTSGAIDYSEHNSTQNTETAVTQAKKTPNQNLNKPKATILKTRAIPHQLSKLEPIKLI
jgi:hypothetical protein